MAWLQRAQRAGYERHDLAAYMGQWDPNATLTAARSASKGPYDRTINLATIRATRAERYFRQPKDGRSLTWSRAQVSIKGQGAEVSWRALSRHSDGTELVAETYALRRTAKGWRVVSNRFWPLETQETGKRVRVYDAATWSKLDAWAARPACFGGRCPSRLLTAWRFAEAWREASRISQRTGGATAHAWLLRGICAVLSGHVADARPSFDRARQLDATLPLPPWRSASPQ